MVRASVVFWCVCTAAAHAAGLTVNVSDLNGVPLGDAVVYAMAGPGAGAVKPSRTGVVAQINRTFVPYVTVVQTGTLVNFPNQDSVRHHVYSFSPAKSFELKLYSGVPAAPVLFDKPGSVVLGCNIHDSMIAFVYVVDTGYFAKTENGAARMELPAGEHELRVWHPQLRGPVPAQRVRVGGDGATAVKVALDTLPKPPQAELPGR